MTQNTAGEPAQTRTSESSASSNNSTLITRHPLLSFFLLAYALTWVGWSPWILSDAGVGLLSSDIGEISILWNVVGLILGPTLVAFIVTVTLEGKEGVIHLLRRTMLWRVGLRWYVFVFLVIPTVVLVSAVVMPGALASFDAAVVPSVLVKLVIIGPILLFIGGPVFEEIGWRGFALPRLQPRYGPLTASLILGVLWGLWHLPLFLVPAWDTPHNSPLDIALFVVLAVSIAVILTWVFNNTKGSVLLAILAHGAFNTSVAIAYDLFPIPAVTNGFANFVIGFAVLALAVSVLTRGHLSYRYDASRIP